MVQLLARRRNAKSDDASADPSKKGVPLSRVKLVHVEKRTAARG